MNVAWSNKGFMISDARLEFLEKTSSSKREIDSDKEEQ